MYLRQVPGQGLPAVTRRALRFGIGVAPWGPVGRGRLLHPGDELSQGGARGRVRGPAGQLEVEPGVGVVGIAGLGASAGRFGLELADQAVEVHRVRGVGGAVLVGRHRVARLRERASWIGQMRLAKTDEGPVIGQLVTSDISVLGQVVELVGGGEAHPGLGQRSSLRRGAPGARAGARRRRRDRRSGRCETVPSGYSAAVARLVTTGTPAARASRIGGRGLPARPLAQLHGERGPGEPAPPLRRRRRRRSPRRGRACRARGRGRR